jgi:nickel-dependent lactate racemase
VNISIKNDAISEKQVEEVLRGWIARLPAKPGKVLLLPPDITRGHAMAGPIVQMLYKILTPDCQVDIMPALGTHVPVTEQERLKMFGSDIPADRFFVHDWRNHVVKIGEIPSDYVRQVSGGLVDYSINVEVNRRLLDQSYDLILSIGQVVPHEVVGMANYTKNILVGCGGKDIIDKSHFLGAAYGMEQMMGRDYSPVRKVFDYAEERYLSKLPLQYILTVTSTVRGETTLNGLFAGRDRGLFEEAVALSQEKNLDLVDEPLKKVVVYLDPEEFRSTWLGNKAIYRTRMAIADDGELIIVAPGLKTFGEDKSIDGLIRKYGYVGSRRVLELVEQNDDLQSNLSAAAHLIHGSSEGRFSITYAPGQLSERETRGVNFEYMPLSEALETYNPRALRDGFNIFENGEEIFFISNPALGLWALKESFQ